MSDGLGRRASTEMLLIMTFMALILVGALLISRVEFQGSVITETEAVAKNTVRQDLKSTSTEFSYVTTDGISLEELLGVYSCYGTDVVDYGGGLTFNVWDEIRDLLDRVYGPDQWALRVEQASVAEIVPLPFIYDSSGSITEEEDGQEYSDYEKLVKLKNIISPMSKPFALGDLSKDNPAVTDCPLSTDTDAHQGTTTANEESWGTATTYICNNGPPIKVGGDEFEYTGWPQGMPKVLFFISDEFSCSCNGQGREDNGNIPVDNTIVYVDQAIAACNAAGVIVFFLLPDSVMGQCRPDGEMIRQGTRLAEGTGGIAVDINNAEKAAEQILSLVEIPDRKVMVDSSKVITEVELPDEGDIVSYNIIYPFPCDEEARGFATLYRWLK